MRLKYYLRGAGVGVLVTTIIFVIVLAFSNYGSVSDEIVVARAKQLGYVLPQEGTISEAMKTGDKETKPESKPSETKPEETKPEETKPAETKPAESKPAETKPETKPQEAVTPGSSTSVTYMPFTINKGEDSETVAQRLEELGLVKDRKAFNLMLAQKGIDDKVIIGTFYVNTGMTEEELCDLMGSVKNRKTSLSDQ